MKGADLSGPLYRYLGHFQQSAVAHQGHNRSGRVTLAPRHRGQTPITFERGALHRQLGVPEGQPIPERKRAAALRGDYGPTAKKRAAFAFKGALAAGRATAAQNRQR